MPQRRPPTIKIHFLDASALAKFVLDELDVAHIRSYSPLNGPFHTNHVCFAEALGVLKRKWLKKDKHSLVKLTQDQYLRAIYFLLARVRSNSIQIIDSPFEEYATFAETESLARKYKKYKLDFSDALQLCTLKNGFYKAFTNNSGPDAVILVTADNKMEKAAKDEGIKTWNCASKPVPSIT